MAAWHTMLDAVRTVIEAVSGVTEAPSLDAESLPTHLRRAGVQMGFALDLQSAPAGDRQRQLVRVEHTLTVSLAATVKQHGQWATTYGAMLDAELDILGALLEADSLPAYSVTWAGTQRSGDGRVYLRSDSVYTLVHTHSTGAN